MTRIVVVPEHLRTAAAQFSRASQELNSVGSRLHGAVGALDWQTCQKAGVDRQVEETTGRLRALSSQAEELASRLTRSAQAFEEADRQGVLSVQVIPWASVAPPAPAMVGALPVVVGIIGIEVIATIGVSTIGVISDIRRSQTATELEKKQIQEAIKALKDVKGLTPAEWKKLNEEERLAALQKVEDALAKAQGRSPVKLVKRDLDGNTWGVYTGNEIAIDTQALQGNDLHRILETVAHEGRHAYQDHAVHNPGFHPDADETKAWRENWDKYLDADKVGMKRYWNQPIERDARHYADQFADTLAPQSRLAEIGEELGEVKTGVL